MTHTTYTPATHPDWSIEEALVRQGHKRVTVAHVRQQPYVYPAILAHASDIAKYEQPPVDPVALVLADYYEALRCYDEASEVRNGSLPEWSTALRKALEKNGMLKGPTQ